MNSSQMALGPDTSYELRFRSLFNEGRGYAFPCDAGGQVNMDRLSDGVRNSYLYARIGVGREFSVPVVQIAVTAPASSAESEGWHTARARLAFNRRLV